MRQYTPYALSLVTATAILLALALFAWRRRAAPGALAFALLMLAVAEWSLGYVLELGSADLAGKLWWASVEYLGIVAVPLVWLVFTLQYTGQARWLTHRNLALLAIEPAIMLLLVWTNGAHGLVWKRLVCRTGCDIWRLVLGSRDLFVPAAIARRPAAAQDVQQLNPAVS